MKQKKGITLIAMIITIIVLLILAGVAISSLLGENGLLNNAKFAQEKYKNEYIKEDEALENYKNEIENIDVLDEKNVYDVWTTWLSLAGIENPQQYNGEMIFQNESLMEKVMDSEEAIEYMSNSKEFIFPKVLESEIAFNKLNSSNKIITIPKLESKTDNIIYNGFIEDFTDVYGTYKVYYPFDRDSATCAATIKAGTEAIGLYIGYDFGKPVKVFKVEGKIRMKSYKIQYSDNREYWIDCIEKDSEGYDYGNEFSDILDENMEKHRYWRLYVNGGQNGSGWSAMVYDLQFYGV